ncbi:MAG: hypothetical protein JEZ11_19915 [Desulfobacterales bacterium]|nr:hypothetical protein [Desulfobacterales bacterium]
MSAQAEEMYKMAGGLVSLVDGAKNRGNQRAQGRPRPVSSASRGKAVSAASVPRSPKAKPSRMIPLDDNDDFSDF